ncbi:MAG: helix-turn-helix domain-containing protein [Porcipelethomonas sp.]
MNNYVTGSTIKALRESKKMTQAQLGDRLGVSDKAISRWETGKGFPDISLIESISKVLGISVIELITGDCVTNKNVSSNMQRSRFYVCPICGNVIHSTGEALISCCGITLPCLEAEEDDSDHYMNIEYIEDELYITANHEMTKQHYISFIAYVTTNKTEIVKLYPEGNAEAGFFMRGSGYIYCFCNHHGLIRQKISRKP